MTNEIDPAEATDFVAKLMKDYGCDTAEEAIGFVEDRLDLADAIWSNKPRVTAYSAGLDIHVVNGYGQVLIEHNTSWEQVVRGADLSNLQVTPREIDVRLGTGMWKCRCGKMVNITNALGHSLQHEPRYGAEARP